MFIAILEDDERRHQVMSSIITGLHLPLENQFFDNAPDMIQWLEEHLTETALISLDHDLGPNRQRAGAVFDPGTGRDVVDFLIQHPPVCPVIVHTSNSYCAPGMMFALESADWFGHRVVPYNDLDWIIQAWLPSLKANLLQPPANA